MLPFVCLDRSTRITQNHEKENNLQNDLRLAKKVILLHFASLVTNFLSRGGPKKTSTDRKRIKVAREQS